MAMKASRVADCSKASVAQGVRYGVKTGEEGKAVTRACHHPVWGEGVGRNAL